VSKSLVRETDIDRRELFAGIGVIVHGDAPMLDPGMRLKSPAHDSNTDPQTARYIPAPELENKDQ
jgi:hypothetical protein